MRDPPPLRGGATISCCSHCLSRLLCTARVATSSNDDCEANDEFVEASNDEDDIFSAADGSWKIMSYSLSLYFQSIFLLQRVEREFIQGCGVRECPLMYPELSGDRPAPAKITFSGVR